LQYLLILPSGYICIGALIVPLIFLETILFFDLLLVQVAREFCNLGAFGLYVLHRESICWFTIGLCLVVKVWRIFLSSEELSISICLFPKGIFFQKFGD